MRITVVDSSVILAILLPEPDAERYIHFLSDAEVLKLSAINYTETSMVYASRTEYSQAYSRVDRFIFEAGIQVEPVSPIHAVLARDGFSRYGKGRHPARLNLADCFAYALAKAYDAPLLFKGNDFTQTDITPALS